MLHTICFSLEFMNVDALWNAHGFSPSDRRKGVGATGHCTGYGQAGWSTEIWQEREEEGEAGAIGGQRGETKIVVHVLVMRLRAMRPCCACTPGKVNVRKSCGSPWLGDVCSCLFLLLELQVFVTNTCPILMPPKLLRWCKIQDLDAWYRDAIVLVDLVQPQGSSVNLLGWATDVPHRCRHGWKARCGENAACCATDLEHTACCKVLINFGHVLSWILHVLWCITRIH